MALLIDAGADTNAADSGKRRIVDYLALNEELTDAKRAAVAARWELQ